MILDKISSALAHLEDVTDPEIEALPEEYRYSLREAVKLLDDVLYVAMQDRRRSLAVYRERRAWTR